MQNKWIVLFFVFLIVCCGVRLPLHKRTFSVDQLFSEFDAGNLPGAAVMVVQKGQVILQKGYGLANLETAEPVTEKTNFRLASVSKQFTAMCILQLIEAEKLALDTKLTDIFSDFPDYGRSISIKDLLQHTSGLQDYEKLAAEDQSRQVKDADVLALMKSADSAYFNSGEKYKYSNSAYAVLTQILEKISGESYSEYIRQNIFLLVGMGNSLAFEEGINQVTNRAFGYTIKEDGTIEFTDQSRFSAVLGDGGIYSNLNDLYLWDQVLYTSTLLTKDLLEQSFERQRNNAGEIFDYGFGWRLEIYNEMEVKYHTGSSRGFRTILYRIPERQFTVVILTNRDAHGRLTTLELAHQISDIFLQ